MSAALGSAPWPGSGIPPKSATSGPTRSATAFGVLQWVAVLAWLAQLILDSGGDNAASATIVLVASSITFQCLRQRRSFEHQPFSSLAVLGLCMTTQWGALVAQSCAWTPMADNLRTPVKTFALLGCYQLMALAGLWLSAHLRFAQTVRRQLGKRLLGPLGIFETPSPAVLWCFGCVGFVAILMGAILGGGGGIGGKLIDGCRLLAWAPFIIPVLAARIAGYCQLPRQLIGIAAYTVAVVGLGMAVNARTVMFIGVMTVALLALMLVLGSEVRMRSAQLWKIVPSVVLTAVAIGYASDLAIATVVVRDQRNSAGPVEMIRLTIETLFDSQVISTFKDSINTYSKLELYDEYYISNQVLTRLIETKFHDNMFFLSSNLQPDELEELKRHSLQIVWATLPEPALNLLGETIDKASLAYSVGDLFDYLHYGATLGGFKIGSIFAHGQALFGHWFFCIYMLMCTVVFTILDSFATWGPDGAARYAPLAMLSVFGTFFNSISGDSIMVVVGFVLRGTIQTVVIYALAFAMIRLLLRSKTPVAPIDAVDAIARPHRFTS